MRDLADSFRALADETRLEMMALLLTRGELCVCDLEEILGVSQSKASRHLRYLKNAGLVSDRRDGLWVHYRIVEDLDDGRRRVIGALRRLLAVGSDRTAGLEQCYQVWQARKARTARACGAPRPSGTRRPARARAASEARR